MAADGRATEIVVIGGGTAGVRLAQRLAASAAEPAPGPGPATAVTLLGEEPHAPYNRVLLGEVLAGRYGPDVISLPPAPGTVRRGVRAVRIDRAQRLVRCDDGSVVPYDRLVLATGSNPVLPALRGLRRSEQGGLPAGVHSFRTMDDCLALSAAVRPGTRAVVIGGGLLGVSAARALAERGAQVVLAQQGEYLMERQLDRTGSLLLRRHLESWGVEVHTECRVRGLVLDDAGEGDPGSDPGPGPGWLAAVELADGFRLDAELTVLACGVRPRTGLARDAGLDVRRGIVVDDELRTSDPYIHAIGDCAEHADRLYGLAGAAIEQADALARSLTAGRAEDRAARYTGTRALTRLTLAALGGPTPQVPPTERPSGPLDLAAFGETTPLPGDDVVQLTDATRGAYRKVVVRGDRLVGGVLLGDLTTIGALARTWEDDEPLPPTTPLLHLLTPDGGF